jgi:hypothetical protein
MFYRGRIRSETITLDYSTQQPASKLLCRMRHVIVRWRASRLASYQLPNGRVQTKSTVGEEYLQAGRFGHVVCEVTRVDDEGWPLILLEQLDYANGPQYAQRVTLVA